MIALAASKIIERLRKGLTKTREALSGSLRSVLLVGRRIDRELLDELEEALISADVGVDTSLRLVEQLEGARKMGKVRRAEEVYEFLKRELKRDLGTSASALTLAGKPPTVILVVGINGSGKTTSIAKLAHLFKERGQKVLLSASDTFRAAAIEQLEIWSQRAGVDMVRHKKGGDPAAVAYDAAEAALARGMDFLIVDTAGRIHTRSGLMRELGKIKRVLASKIPGAPHEVLLVLDATTGQNAISQANLFKEAAGVTGIFLAKLDGTAKGGIVVAIKRGLDIPVKFVGLGENLNDLAAFDSKKFVEALFE